MSIEIKCNMPEAKETITVFYACTSCGLREVALPVRTRGDEDVMVWLEAVKMEASFDHALRSPNCKSGKMDYLKVPFDGRDKVGGPIIQ